MVLAQIRQPDRPIIRQTMPAHVREDKVRTQFDKQLAPSRRECLYAGRELYRLAYLAPPVIRIEAVTDIHKLDCQVTDQGNTGSREVHLACHLLKGIEHRLHER